jgi:hypothetical protein
LDPAASFVLDDGGAKAFTPVARSSRTNVQSVLIVQRRKCRSCSENTDGCSQQHSAQKHVFAAAINKIRKHTNVTYTYVRRQVGYFLIFCHYFSFNFKMKKTEEVIERRAKGSHHQAFASQAKTKRGIYSGTLLYMDICLGRVFLCLLQGAMQDAHWQTDQYLQ